MPDINKILDEISDALAHPEEPSAAIKELVAEIERQRIAFGMRPLS